MRSMSKPASAASTRSATGRLETKLRLSMRDEFARQGDDGCMGVTHWRLSSPVFLPGCYEPTRLAAPQEDMTNRNSDDGDD